MVRRDRNKINNLRDDLKKFQNNLWELENSDGFQFCAKYAEKCSKGNKFGFKATVFSKYGRPAKAKTERPFKGRSCLWSSRSRILTLGNYFFNISC